MKANELRIGNYVYGINRRSEIHISNELPLKVLQIELFNIEVLPLDQNPATVEKWFKISNQDVSPIPLTEEWLLKFRFKQTDEGAGFKALHFWKPLLNDDKLYLRGYFAGGFIWGFNEFIELGQPIAIEYVHQLQNLYFVLTGEELTIN